MKIDLTHCAPPGMDLRIEQRILTRGLFCALLYSFGFLFRLSAARASLFRWNGSEKYLLPNAVMPDFYVLLRTALVGFLIVALCMAALVIYHYLYYRQGSKSIYLMKRLPDRWELHRRCLTLPLIACAICLLTAGTMLLIYYGIYIAAVPEGCLTPHQWQMIWERFL